MLYIYYKYVFGKSVEAFSKKTSKTANILVYHIKFRSHWVTHLSHSLCLYTPLVCQDRLRRMSSYNMMLSFSYYVF